MPSDAYGDPGEATSGSLSGYPDSASDWGPSPAAQSFTPPATSYWQGATDYVGELEDKALLAYANSAAGSTVDKGLAKVAPAAQAVTDAASKYLGYAADPVNVANMLDTIKWILIVGGVLYVVVMFAPAIRAVL